MPEIYVSVDIESDGPVPGLNSMLSLGAVAFDPVGKVLSKFQRNMKCLDGAVPDSKTMNWWEGEPEAWAVLQENVVSPRDAMKDFREWLGLLNADNHSHVQHKLTFVGYPAAFDHAFVHYYLMRFGGSDPFGHQALDIKTYAMAAMSTEFKETHKGSMPKEWFRDVPEHKHVAWQDALEQGMLFFEIRAALMIRRSELEQLEYVYGQLQESMAHQTTQYKSGLDVIMKSLRKIYAATDSAEKSEIAGQILEDLKAQEEEDVAEPKKVLSIVSEAVDGAAEPESEDKELSSG